VSRRGWLLFIAMCVIWGIPYLLIKVAVADLHPTAQGRSPAAPERIWPPNEPSPQTTHALCLVQAP
jgi:hypothetical protein